jgi:hypothetical protein
MCIRSINVTNAKPILLSLSAISRNMIEILGQMFQRVSSATHQPERFIILNQREISVTTWCRELQLSAK